MSDYERKIWLAADDLRHSLGRKPSRQEVLDQVGGSMGTVNKYMRTWEAMIRGDNKDSTAKDLLHSAVNRVYEELQKHIEEDKIALTEQCNAKVAQVSDKLETVSKELLQTRTQLSDYIEKIGFLEKEKHGLEDRLAKLQAKLESTEEHFNEVQAIAGERERTIISLENILQQERLKTSTDAKIFKDHIKELEDSVNAKIETNSKLTSELASAQSTITRQAEEITKIKRSMERPFSRSRMRRAPKQRPID